MQSVAYVSHSSSLATPSGLWVGGDLSLNQRRPLRASGRSHSYDSLLNTSSQSWEDYQLSSILSNYHRRECEAASITCLNNYDSSHFLYIIYIIYIYIYIDIKLQGGTWNNDWL